MVRTVIRGYGLTQQSLARTLNVAPKTIGRWLNGTSPPTGLSEEVIVAMHRALASLPETRARAIGNELRLGLGDYLHRAITHSRKP